jgi:hypothetical protein
MGRLRQAIRRTGLTKGVREASVDPARYQKVAIGLSHVHGAQLSGPRVDILENVVVHRP